MTKEQFNYILDRIDQTISQNPFLNNNYEMLCAFANCFYWTFASDDFLENVLDENGNSIHFISGSESDIFHTIDLAKKYLHHVSPEYAELLEQYIEDGTLDMNYDLVGSFTYFFPKEERTQVDCAIDGRTSDVTSLIHEFFHATNRMSPNGIVGPARDYFTEMISIFYETDCVWYLYCQGDIEKDTLKSTLYERLSDTLAICRKIVMQSDMVCLYRKVGPIEIDNDETYRFVSQYDETNFFEDEDDYYEAVADMIATIPDDVLNGQKELSDYCNTMPRFYGYIVGTMFALSIWQAKQNGDSTISNEILWLNKNLNEIGFGEVYQHLKALDGKTIEDVCLGVKEIFTPYFQDTERIKRIDF